MFYIDDYYGNVYGYENGKLVCRRHSIKIATWPTREAAQAALMEYMAEHANLTHIWVSFDPDLE